MRIYRQHFDGVEVDLDNPETYKNLPKDVSKLDNLIMLEIGKTLCYMDYFMKEHYPMDNPQRLRINRLIKNFCDNRGDEWNNVQWFQEQLFLIKDETGNQC